ncbi:MAG: hypothetical protein QOE29_1858 [Gaiellaceae bacterium]|jgi:hypothetical protein|nr:hypothetical protein [Gaiellaceae bacterium]
MLSPTSPRLARTSALIRLSLVATLVAGVALLASGPALAKKPVSCGQQVINDWEDGQIDKSYPTSCYKQALTLVSPEQQQYSSLPADIERALQAATNGKVPGGQIGNAFGAKYQQALVHQRAINRLAQPFNHRDEVALPESDANPLSSHLLCVIAGCGASASGLPLPLLILGGLAFLLLAAGTAGMVIRKLNERRLPPPGTA